MEVDFALIDSARKLRREPTYRINLLIICYEEAVRKSNQGGAYRPEFEIALKDFVKQQTQK
jgi:hypothetical protein